VEDIAEEYPPELKMRKLENLAELENGGQKKAAETDTIPGGFFERILIPSLRITFGL
jgi:hypothetical protein